MSYCNGNCKYLNQKKHKCELTGEKLIYMKWKNGIEFIAHEHLGFCKEDIKQVGSMSDAEECEDYETN